MNVFQSFQLIATCLILAFVLSLPVTSLSNSANPGLHQLPLFAKCFNLVCVCCGFITVHLLLGNAIGYSSA